MYICNVEQSVGQKYPTEFFVPIHYQRLCLYEKVLDSNTYGTLNKDIMLDRFKNNEAPSFKDVSVLIPNAVYKELPGYHACKPYQIGQEAM